MGKKLKQLLQLNLDDLPIALGMVSLPWLLIHLVTGVVMVGIHPDESIMIAGTLLPIAVGLAACTVTMGNTQITFVQAVKFGSTRKTALALTLAQTAIETLEATALGLFLLFLERVGSMPFWRFLSGNPELLVDDFGFVWWSIPLGAVIGFAVGLLYGAALLRFGTKALRGFLVVWFGGLAGVQLLPWKTHEVTNVLFPVLALLGILGAVWSVWTMLHHSITK